MLTKARSRKLARLRDDFGYWARCCYHIRDKHANLVPLRLNRAQQVVLDAERSMLDEEGVARLYILKARQGGITTAEQAKNLHTAWSTRGAAVMTLAHSRDDTDKIFRITRRAIDNFPEGLLPAMGRGMTREISFTGLDSMFWTGTAGAKRTGRGVTLKAMHGCLVPECDVLLADGSVAAIADVLPGEAVVTHTGAIATVRGVSTTRAEQLISGTRTIAITPWLHRMTPVVCTPDHRFWTARGWVRADSLTTSDEIGFPVRPITGEITAIPYRRETVAREQGGGSQVKDAADIPLNRETGFAFGYYLADGCVARQASGRKRPSSIVFAHDVAEEEYPARATAALAPWSTSASTRRHKNSRTTVTTVWGTGIARTIAEEFGKTDEKSVPGWVWQAPREFAEGLVAGYFAGDGSKGLARRAGYTDPRVSLTSVRLHLLTQLRDLLASLGIGWGALAHKPAGLRAGRNEREAWTLVVMGTAAIRLRRMIGMEVPEDDEPTSRRRAWTEKYRIDNGTVWVRLRSVEPGPPRSVFHDLVLDHPDHSFRLLAGLAHNSEFAFWDEPLTTLNAIMPAMMPHGSSVRLETTASAHGSEAHGYWNDAENGTNGFRAVFLPWWICDYELYRVPLDAPDELGTLEPEEQHLIDRHGLDLEQIKWRRETMARMGRSRFMQEYAEDPESCWLVAGDLFYDGEVLKYLYDTAPEPIRKDHVSVDGWAGHVEVYAHQEGFDWEHERVIAGMDVAEGGAGDRTTWTFRTFPSWHLLETFQSNTIEPKAAAALLNQRALKHGKPLLVIEKNGHGITVLRELRDTHRYPAGKLYHRSVFDQQTKMPTLKLGWATTGETKPLLLDAGREIMNAALKGTAGVPSRAAIRDAFNVVRDAKGKVELTGRDMLVAEALAWMGRDYNIGGTSSFMATI